MGSLGYCDVCNGENCMRGPDVCCISCGRPRDAKVKPAEDLDALLVGAAVATEPEQEPVVVASKKMKR